MSRIRRSFLRPRILVACIALVLAYSAVAGEFRRGDAGGSGGVEVSDGVRILMFIFAGAEELDCPDAGDTNDSGHIDIADPVHLRPAVPFRQRTRPRVVKKLSRRATPIFDEACVSSAEVQLRA